MDREEKRLKLQEMLEHIPGVKKVYFQPPPNERMVYPCIRYARSVVKAEYANGAPYIENTDYELFVIDANPDSEIVAYVSRLPYCQHTNHYCADGLHHDRFRINHI
jgi:hypothetical protein